mmetsp:Transcript_25982/g.66246  ORF Transcript_25982/g.66246 Transcript_25982/m.66246 type:complete len:258 (+) Transcript_25982:1051-1824(+)
MTTRCVEFAAAMCPRLFEGGFCVYTLVHCPPLSIVWKTHKSFITPPMKVDLHPPKRIMWRLSSVTVLEGFQRGVGAWAWSLCSQTFSHSSLSEEKAHVSPRKETFLFKFLFNGFMERLFLFFNLLADKDKPPSSVKLPTRSDSSSTSSSPSSSPSSSRTAASLCAASGSARRASRSSGAFSWQPLPLHFQMKPLPPNATNFSSPPGHTKLCNSGDLRHGGCETNSTAPSRDQGNKKVTEAARRNMAGNCNQQKQGRT